MSSNLIFNIPAHEVYKRLKRIDFVCTDLDECLFPFFTQVLVAGEILFEAFFKKGTRRFIPQLSWGAFRVCTILLITFGNIKWLGNEKLMRYFEQTMKGIPLSTIKKHAEYIHTFFYDMSIDFLRRFAERHIPVVILSLSIQPILDTIQEHLIFIDQAKGNNICVNDGESRFVGYETPLLKSGQDKYVQFIRMIEEKNASCPLIIGHCDDELPLVSFARDKRGISIGINPKKKFRHHFDIILNAVNWEPLHTLFDTHEG